MTTRTLGFALLFILVLTPVALAAQEQGSWHRLPAAPITPDFNRTSVWTGKEMLVFGRDQQTALDANGNPYATKSLNVAAAYNPRTDTWRSLDPPRATTGFMNLSSVWTGKEMLVWGQGTREAFNPVTNTWRGLSGSRLLSIHDGFGAVVWTGRELIGWGGGCCGDAFSDGVAYSAARSTWRALPRAPLAGSQHPLSVWTGRRMIVISGARAASYEPATNSWKRIAQPPAARGNGTAVWDGREMLVFGGTRNGFAYSPRSDSWRALPLVPAGRVGGVAVLDRQAPALVGREARGRGVRSELEPLVGVLEWPPSGTARAERSLDGPLVDRLGWPRPRRGVTTTPQVPPSRPPARTRSRSRLAGRSFSQAGRRRGGTAASWPLRARPPRAQQPAGVRRVDRRCECGASHGRSSPP